MAEVVKAGTPYAQEIERYMRSGERSRLTPEREGEGYRLPREWIVQGCAVEKRELYAMPAATAEFLDNPKTNLRNWLLSEVESRFKEQLNDFPGGIVGPLRILRDPYSAKPYVLFYVSAEAMRPIRNAYASNQALIDELVGALERIAKQEDEDDEWEGTEAFRGCREIARAAVLKAKAKEGR